MALGDIFSASKGIAFAGKAKKGKIKPARKALKKAVAATAETRAGATGAIDKYTGKAAQTLAGPLAELGDYIRGQTARYEPAADIWQGSYGLRGEEGARQAEEAYRLSLRPGQHLANENILRLGSQGVRSGGTLTDLADYEFQTNYDPWRQGVAANVKQFDPYTAIAQQGNLASNLANIYGNAGGQSANAFVQTNPANLYTNFGNVVGDARSQYAGDVFGAQQGALTNQWQALTAGTNLAGKLLGQGFG